MAKAWCIGVLGAVALSCSPSSSSDPGNVAPPPAAGQHRVTVALQGQGTVSSSPAGINCGTTCAASFNDGTVVTLTPAAASAWVFSAWSGTCTGATCTITVGGSDATATATFTQTVVPPPPPPPPPPPADECAGLMPDAVPAPVVAQLPQNYCLDGTSDDGTGTFALGFTAGGAGPTYPSYVFFTIQNGQAVRIGDTIPGGDLEGTYVYSQPSGFTALIRSGFDGASTIHSYSHEGTRQSSQTLAPFQFPGDHQPTSAIGIDPSGGTATLRHVYDANSGWSTIYKRLDKMGNAETGDVVIDRGTMAVSTIGVALSGNALAVLSAAGGVFQAQWLAKDGTAISEPFTFQGFGTAVVRFLMDGSVIVGFSNGSQTVSYQKVTWKYRVQDGHASVDPVPDFIVQRPGSVFWVIRSGRGYAFVNSNQCGANSAEILAASGKSCGCLNVQYAGAGSSVGRDGSLIVPEPPVNFGTCTFDLYPQLLK